MSLAQLLADHGYLAVFIASLLEGETILVLAGFAAHQGLLSLPLTLTLAFIGGTLGDQFFFWLGHRWGTSLLRRIPGSDQRAQRVRELLGRYDALLIVGIRFMYGLRIIGPIAMGTGGVSPWRFARYNVLGGPSGRRWSEAWGTCSETRWRCCWVTSAGIRRACCC